MHRSRSACADLRIVIPALATVALASTPTPAAVEVYLSEANYLERLSALGHGVVTEGFDSSAWDGARSVGGRARSLPSVTSRGVNWEAAGLDLWDVPTPGTHGVSTNFGWARTGHWGVFEEHDGDSVPTTLRVSATAPIYGVGGWVNSDPDGQSIGFLFEGRGSANSPGYVISGLGAMYPVRNTGDGHSFVGVVDPDGFASVVLTGTLEGDGGALEGGADFGADDFTIALESSMGGDYNDDGVVDAADYAVWRDNLGAPAGSLPNDPNGGPIGAAQYATWRENFGRSEAPPAAVAAPEPPACVGALAILAAVRFRARRRGSSVTAID